MEVSNEKKKISISKFITLKRCVIVSIPIYIMCILINLFYFTPTTTLEEFIGAFTQYDPENLIHYVTMFIKIPRLIGGIIIGALLAVGGATMQGITKNYLASPDIAGIDSGAGLGLSIAMAINGGVSSYTNNIIASMIGATIATVIIFYISSKIRGNESGVKLLLAGSAIGMLFSGISTSINILSETGKSINIWNNSGLVGIRWVGILVLLIGVLGVIISFIIAPKITIMGMGDETAVSLGENIKKTKILGVISVVFISTATVCTVGNIGFIGLVIPNMVKMAVGDDYKKVIPISAYFGSLLLVFSDVASRFFNPPAETPIGTITSIIGIPIFLYLVNSKRSKEGA